MKILYGLSGEGSGHSSRSKEIISYLQKKGHIIKVVSHDRGYENLKDYFNVTEITGLRLSFHKNKINHTLTVLKNIMKTPKYERSLKKVLNIINDFNPDITLVDFEPVTCTAANIKRIPVISIDNQHILTDTKINYPRQYTSEALKTKAVVNLFVVNAKAHVITTFFHEKILNKKAVLVPPIIRQEVFEMKPEAGDYILVYLTYEYNKVIDILKDINKNFIVYGFNIDKTEKNITFKKSSGKGFLKDLACCEGVLANSGFSLISECLYLKKPFLALPVQNQFEQFLNAFYLDKCGYGKFYEELDREKIEAFLYNIEFYREKLQNFKNSNNKKVFKTVEYMISKFAKVS